MQASPLRRLISAPFILRGWSRTYSVGLLGGSVPVAASIPVQSAAPRRQCPFIAPPGRGPATRCLSIQFIVGRRRALLIHFIANERRSAAVRRQRGGPSFHVATRMEWGQAYV